MKTSDFFFLKIMEAVEKLKEANLDSTTFSMEGNYSGGFKNGKRHGFGYFYEKRFHKADWVRSSYSEGILSLQVHIDG